MPWLTSLMLLLLGCPLDVPPTQGSEVSVDEDLAQQIQDLVEAHHREGRFNGAILVADSGKIITNRVYGQARFGAEVPLTDDSVFEIASVSKQFTAMMIMMLAEDGKLAFDDPVHAHLPSFPFEQITIRHMLTHTSGLSERQFFAWAGQNMEFGQYYTNRFVLDYLIQEEPELAFESGSQWEYSNVGYFMLALIIEKHAGKKYAEFLDESILQPLGMTHSGIKSQKTKETLENYADGHLVDPGTGNLRSSFGLAWSDEMYGGVGILSNTTDLLRWDQALYTEKLVKKETLKEAFTPYLLSDGTSSGYGFGWYVREDYEVGEEQRETRLDHNGLWPGYESSIVRYLNSRKTIIVLSNQAPSAKDELVEEISELLFE